MSGGGGGGPSTQTVNQNSIPDWLKPYAMQMFGNAASLTMGPNSGYQAYTGQRQANYNPMQTQAMTNLQQMQPSSQTGQATGMAGLAGLRMGQMANYKPSQVTTMDYTGANVNKYMSPYMNAVVDVQKKNAMADYARSMPNQNAGAAAMGALGGSRNAIQQSEQGRNLANQLEGIQATGSQAAFQNAQAQFNAQQQAQEQAAMANQGAGLTANSQNLQALQGQLGAAGTLGQLGMNDYQQRSGINNAQLGLGQYMQQQEQKGLDTRYQDYMAQQQYPYSQLQFMNSLVHGFAPNSMSTVYGGQPNTLGQVAGLAGGVAGLSNIWS
jgi:hypothetical protein